MMTHLLRFRVTLLLVSVLFGSLHGQVRASVYVDGHLKARHQLRQAAQAGGRATFHLFSHGRPGELLLNGRWLDQKQILSFLSVQLAGSTVNHVNIYGCEFGRGDKGRRAVEFLQRGLGVAVSASDDVTGKDGDWELEVGARGMGAVAVNGYAFNLQYSANDDFDGDGIPNGDDLDDDNDGVLDSQEILVQTLCTNRYPDNASTNIVPSATAFPAGRELARTYDNNLNTYGGAAGGTAELLGTVTYVYGQPVNDVTAFTFYSNGGSVLNDGQVTHIASIKFYDTEGNVLFQQDDVNVPQASSTNPFVITFPSVLQGVASFSLTDLSDRGARSAGAREAIWKDVHLVTCAAWQDIDTDGDGIANRFDLDSDGDGCPDTQEASVVDAFPSIPFASAQVFNGSGFQPAVLSVINPSTFRDLNANGFDDRLEAGQAGVYAGTYSYGRAVDAADAICTTVLDSDGDGIPDDIDLDDDNDGVLDTEEMGPGYCVLNVPDAATTDIPSSAAAFPPARSLANTYDNNLGTFGGSGLGQPALNGTVKYLYDTPLNNVTEFQFFSNGGSVLSDGQVTNIASLRFYDSSDQLLFQQDNLVIPQASSVSPYIFVLPAALNGVASFSLTDLSDQTHGAASEAVWREVKLRSCLASADIDTDNDGIVNRLDLDSDGDGCPDSQEAAVVSSFANVVFANINVVNTGGSAAASYSQVAAQDFQDLNDNGLDDRFESVTAGSYTGTYTYSKATDNQVLSCSALPVTLVSFGAKPGPEGVDLQWTTSGEENFAGFSIERSVDPRDGFTTVGFVGGGSSSYRFADGSPAKGDLYYRLKMLDADGSFSYSKIVQIYLPYGEQEHVIFPNPAKSYTISIYNYFPIEDVKVYNASGRSVAVKVTRQKNAYQFNLDKASDPGLYILEYSVNGKMIRRKFVVD